MFKESFEAILPPQPRILILGSLPGDQSLARQQYYGHPQNRFWKILFHIYGEKGNPTDYNRKVQFLHAHHIALWDVCATAHRMGSMDTAITAVIPNPIAALIDNHPSLLSIYFNGQKAQKLYDQYFERNPKIIYHTLPSSSPANAQYSLDKLVDNWKIIR